MSKKVDQSGPTPKSVGAISGTERVQKLREEYWEKVKNIDPENLVFIDETNIMR